MKKIILAFCHLILLSNLIAQQNVVLKINHKLGNQTFALNQTTTNNLNNNFKYTRFEYYISGVKIIHDGGQITPVANFYALINANTATTLNLGSIALTNLESIQFSVGVNTPQNNADPALWPAAHPLSPKIPSMHWGWSSGYRFAAIEGLAGSPMTTVFEVHALGNSNYMTTTVNCNGILNNGNLEILLDADCSKAVSNINVANGEISHGSNGSSVSVLLNFKNLMFTNNPLNVSKINMISNEFSVFPNPSNNGKFSLVFNKTASDHRVLKITDISGKIIQQNTLSEITNNEISISSKGIYFLVVSDGSILVISKKLIVF